MDQDTPDFLSESTAAAGPDDYATPEGDGPPRDEQGGFEAEADFAPQEGGRHSVPLATLLQVRDELSAAKAELQALRAWSEAQEAGEDAPEAVEIPDPHEDPESFAAWQDAQMHGALHQQRLEFSRSLAEVRHGPDVVGEAYDWGFRRCDQDPFFNARVAASPDPVETVVQEWRRELALSHLGDNDLSEFLAWKAGRSGQAQQPLAGGSAPPAFSPPFAAPRPSLAGAPSAGSAAAPGTPSREQTFDRMFGS